MHQSRKGVGSFYDLHEAPGSKASSITPQTSTDLERLVPFRQRFSTTTGVHRWPLQLAKRLHNREISRALEHPETSLFVGDF